MPTAVNPDAAPADASQCSPAALRAARERFLHDLLCVAFVEPRQIRDFADLRTAGSGAQIPGASLSDTAASYVALVERVEGLDVVQDPLFRAMIEDIARSARVLQWDRVRAAALKLGVPLPERQPASGLGDDAHVVVTVDSPGMTLGERYAFIAALTAATGHALYLGGYRVEGARTYLDLETSPAGRRMLGRLGAAGIVRHTRRPVVRLAGGGLVMLGLWGWLRTHAALSLTVTIFGVAVTLLSIQVADDHARIAAGREERDSLLAQVADGQASIAALQQVQETWKGAVDDLNAALTSAATSKAIVDDKLAQCLTPRNCPPTLSSAATAIDGHVVINPGQSGPLRHSGGSQSFMLARATGSPEIVEVEVADAVFAAAGIEELNYYDSVQIVAGWQLGAQQQPVLRATSLQRLRIGARRLARISGRSKDPDCAGDCRGFVEFQQGHEPARKYRLIWTRPPDMRDVAGVRITAGAALTDEPRPAIVGGSIAGDTFESYDLIVFEGPAVVHR